MVSFLEQKRRRAGGRFFSGAVRRAGGRFSGAEKSAATIFLQQKREPDNFWVYLLYRKVFLD